MRSITGAPLRVNPADVQDTSGSSDGAPGGFQLVGVTPVAQQSGGPPSGRSAAAAGSGDPAGAQYFHQQNLQQEEYNFAQQNVLLLEENQQMLVQQNLMVNDPALLAELDRRGRHGQPALAAATLALHETPYQGGIFRVIKKEGQNITLELL